MIEDNEDIEEAIMYLKENCNTIKRKELQNIYKKEDMILASEHKIKDTYTKMFGDNKYSIEENTRLFKKGEVVYEQIEGIKTEKKHGFTIHSVQGETYTNKLFIDMNRHKSIRMLYTAISRAKALSQIYLIL